MMTKQEEREALKKIEKIIKAAGPDSYIGMAFAGCCEIAADNIESDFGNSPKAKIEALEKELKEEKQKFHYWEKDCERLERAVKKLADEKEELRQQLKQERAKQIPAALYKLVWLAIDEHISAANARINEAVDTLVAFADHPHDIAVTNALQRIKEARDKKEKHGQLLEELEKYEPDNV